MKKKWKRLTEVPLVNGPKYPLMPLNTQMYIFLGGLLGPKEDELNTHWYMKNTKILVKFYPPHPTNNIKEFLYSRPKKLSKATESYFTELKYHEREQCERSFSSSALPQLTFVSEPQLMKLFVLVN